MFLSLPIERMHGILHEMTQPVSGPLVSRAYTLVLAVQQLIGRDGERHQPRTRA
jgi:hypothetical protein